MKAKKIKGRIKTKFWKETFKKNKRIFLKS